MEETELPEAERRTQAQQAPLKEGIGILTSPQDYPPKTSRYVRNSASTQQWLQATSNAIYKKYYKRPAVLYIRNTTSDQQCYIENSASNQQWPQATSNAMYIGNATSDQQCYIVPRIINPRHPGM